MLAIRDLNGQEEPFVSFVNLTRRRKINGEKIISLTIHERGNPEAYTMIEEEAAILFEDDVYIIKTMTEKTVANASFKQVEAIYDFYVNMINMQQDHIHNGSITFNNYMDLVFEGTGYTYETIDSFYARSFENLGDESRLALLQKGLDRFQAEMELVGDRVYLRHRTGVDTDFQFRYGHNIKTIERKVDTKDLATVIRGTGDPELGITAYHRSDNWQIFGEIDAPSVRDERFKSEETLLEEMKSRLKDTPEFSITIDFADLRAAGYPYTVPNEGDSVFVINELMDDLVIETRILEIEETFDLDLQPIKTITTLANYKKTFAGTLFDNTNKRLREIVNDDGMIRYSVLDEAVRIATESLESAQTELDFDNGIIAREKTDPNQMVLFNSKGLGISKNGGADFHEAITSDGFVLTAGAIGRLKANNIELGPSTEFYDNYDPSKKETPSGAQEKVNALKKEVDENLNDVGKSVTDLNEYVDEAFKDGVIEEAEALAIEKYINSLIAEKSDVDAHYNEIYSNSHLVDTPKSNLLNAKVNYNGAHNELIAAINNAIADGRTTAAEKHEVDGKFDAYSSTLSALSARMEAALDAIGQSKSDAAEKNAKDHTDNKDTTLRENLRLASPLPTSLALDIDGITAFTADPNRYARLDHRGLYIRGGAIQIDGGLPENQIDSADKWNTGSSNGNAAKTSVDSNKTTWDRAGNINSDGTLNTSKLNGDISDNQIASASKWNGQGTYIDENGIYTGTVTANQMQTGVLESQNGVSLFNLNNGNLTINHDDGTFTRMSRSGLQRYTGSDMRNFHYLVYTAPFVMGTSGGGARWIQLPDDFKGKPFTVYVAVADSLGAQNYYRAIQRIVATGHPNHSNDYENARVPVIAYKSETFSDGEAPRISDIQGLLIAVY